jgi:hypothetical protein
MINHNEIFVRIREMCITDAPLTIQEAETLMQHAVYLSGVRKKIRQPVAISRRSGHRPAAYEISKGRTGTSEHSTFGLPNRGAVDLVYSKQLLDQLISDDFYTRICYYPNNGFIHADRLPVERRTYFEASSPTAAWVTIRFI